MSNLAATYSDLGRHTDALQLGEEVLEAWKTDLGPRHPDTPMSMNNLALTSSNLGRHADALQLKEEVLEARKTELGPRHPDTLRSMNNLAAVQDDEPWCSRGGGVH
jgi:tetratricopeptide (TPR) repeat protein